VREEDLTGFEKVVESFKKQNGEYKSKLAALQDSFSKEREEYLEAIEQLKSQIKVLRRDQSEKEN
jgi:CHASE3 domain sensor protein